MDRAGNITVADGGLIRFREETDIFFCDPCYVINHTVPYLDEAWGDLCTLMFKKGANRSQDGMGYLKMGSGHEARFLYQSTAYGDGCYGVHSSLKQVGHDAGVDAGLLSVWSLADVKAVRPDWPEEEYARLGVIVRGFKGEIHTDGEGNWSGSNSFSCMTKDDEEEEECPDCGSYDYDGWTCESCDEMEEED